MTQLPCETCSISATVRDWGGGGGATKWEGGHVKFYPYKKGGRKKF